jgi:hypothetical protein
VNALRSGDDVERDAAAARLRVIGARALPRLSDLIDSDAAAPARCAALSAIEGIDDPRAVTIARRALPSDDPSIVIAAVAVLRGWLSREAGTEILEALTAVAVDASRDARARRAALEALSDLPRELVQPILDRQPPPASAAFDDPDAAREWVTSRGAEVPLSALHDAIVRLRSHEQGEPLPVRRREWQAARASAHAALARRGSRIAVYDLRETFETATAALPIEFLTAIGAIGDASCLEPLAHAWANAGEDTWWRDHLAAAAQEIVHRTRLSGRSAVMKRLRVKFVGFI